MFTGFDFRTTRDFGKFESVAKELFSSHKTVIKSQLDQFLLADGESLDATDMQNAWFPGVDANVFISHSHKDENLALGLAGYLQEEFGIASFIDSCVWGFANDLLQEIDDSYCKSEGKSSLYDYQLRNYSTSHVHMMLANALTMMIDKTECVIFVNTPESISTADVMKNKTKSPWIYHEIAMTQLVRRKSRKEHREDILEKSGKFAKKLVEDSKFPSFYYKLDLSHLHGLTDYDLYQWENGEWKDDCFKYLDVLYEMKGLPQVLSESY